VYVPGDNDWTDCHRPSNGAYDPLERLDTLRKRFFSQPYKTLGQYPMAVETQADNPAFAAYREHQRWQIGPVLFVTLNVPGSGNNYGRNKTPSDEFVQRGAAVKAWIAESFARARKDRLEGIVLVLQANLDIEDFSAGQPNRRYGVWGAMEPKTNVSLTTSAQSLLPRQFPRLIFRTFRKYCLRQCASELMWPNTTI
jgi:hypothetical protein